MLAEFLGDNPAGDTVQRRRVSAINRHHLDAGHVPPGRTTSIRVALDSVRAQRITRRADCLHAIAEALPAGGTNEALFGCRDAILLLLAGAGLSYQAIVDLDRTDVEVDGQDVWIGDRHRIRIPARSTHTSSPAQLWARWSDVLQFSDRYPSTTLLAEQLQRSTFPDMGEWPKRPGPVAVPIDQWGHMPFPPHPMTSEAVATIVHAYLTDAPPRRKSRRPARQRIDDDENTQDSIEAHVAKPVSADLDPDYYERGVQARRRAHVAMADVPDLVDDVEDRIEELLQRTLDLLDGVGVNKPRAAVPPIIARTEHTRPRVGHG
ncbi:MULTISPECIES: hypothetical protein [unclassified Rhodococcus (in: high G+C Gram-positive bacteria)]|uniref:hypothetical protein n=1 Tax=unclassified Rhodococcus (in: high G+C Gram-positive bacteria) TaxID=192944 RepID=UPI001C9AAC19|nr:MULTISPECIES: hypothetical protein [unclassified Rhodococcus (in: high G+C Gram-positive bacteria)]MBY6487407.1 hypothetical protein [Rhodococcus sp. BP-265]MBY6497175.1 hypothetical protein [Rhodococcus sp. BP-314]MBY6560234.1 hypothetical protein [Rhodococcus sp. BP-146]MBY6414670.1 hypothetical protein [Rhodococcus sp. BP-320]MBY6424493.1 hypothetical protein [Rhodococcus sp. BP-324]